MVRFFNHRGGVILVTAILIVQIVLFLLSMDAGAYAKISIFCTGPASSRFGFLFGSLHLLFVPFLLIGLLSLKFTRLRLLYAGLLAVSLGILPIQAAFVSRGTLTCDSP